MREPYLPDEGGKIGVFEVSREEVLAEERLIEDLKGVSLWPPADDVFVVGLFQHFPRFFNETGD